MKIKINVEIDSNDDEKLSIELLESVKKVVDSVKKIDENEVKDALIAELTSKLSETQSLLRQTHDETHFCPLCNTYPCLNGCSGPMVRGKLTSLLAPFDSPKEEVTIQNDRSVVTLSPFVAHTSGKGFWSRAAKPVTITGIEIEEEYNSCFVYFSTDDWDVNNDGLIYTDPLFIEELLIGLKKQNINILMDYSEQGLQGDNYVHFDIYKEKKK